MSQTLSSLSVQLKFKWFLLAALKDYPKTLANSCPSIFSFFSSLLTPVSLPENKNHNTNLKFSSIGNPHIPLKKDPMEMCLQVKKRPKPFVELYLVVKGFHN